MHSPLRGPQKSCVCIRWTRGAMNFDGLDTNARNVLR